MCLGLHWCVCVGGEKCVWFCAGGVKDVIWKGLWLCESWVWLVWCLVEGLFVYWKAVCEVNRYMQ